MSREFTVIVEQDEEGYFVATVPAIAGCHTQSRSRDELGERIREAIAACLEGDDEQPPVLRLVAVERVTVPV